MKETLVIAKKMKETFVVAKKMKETLVVKDCPFLEKKRYAVKGIDRKYLTRKVIREMIIVILIEMTQWRYVTTRSQ